MKTTTHDPESKLIDLNSSFVCRTVLEQTLREGAQRMLQTAVEAEVHPLAKAHRCRRPVDPVQGELRFDQKGSGADLRRAVEWIAEIWQRAMEIPDPRRGGKWESDREQGAEKSHALLVP